ncbi:MAG: hypothetical protein KDA24_03880 [Deltaproteobacteria bacterium]|nr:hypothetical protein [Deltaproteobacteria bacterium]
MNGLRLAAVALLLLAVGCGTPEVSVETVGTVDVVPDTFSRERRRMNVDQLRSAVIATTGGISWTELRGTTNVDLFLELSPTLGKPDYLGATEEELEPALLFQKFLDDASKKVCADLIELEQLRTPGERVFLVRAELTDPATSQAARANLRAALLRFHGHDWPEGDSRLQPWQRLIEQADDGFGIELAWQTVCVALFTHPDFYSY